MKFPQNRQASALVASAFIAWVVMLLVSTVTWVMIVGPQGRHGTDEPLGELAMLFPMIMALPFAYVLGVVYLPVLAVVRTYAGDSRFRLCLAGALVGPFAGLVLLVTGGVLWGNPGNTEDSLSGLLGIVRRDAVYSSPWVLALVLGGVTLELAVSWFDRTVAPVDTPSNT